MKISNVILVSLVVASLSVMSQEKPKDPKPPVKTVKKKEQRPEDKRKAKRDSINKAKIVNEKWDCPPCGMG